MILLELIHVKYFKTLFQRFNLNDLNAHLFKDFEYNFDSYACS